MSYIHKDMNLYPHIYPYIYEYIYIYPGDPGGEHGAQRRPVGPAHHRR